MKSIQKTLDHNIQTCTVSLAGYIQFAQWEEIETSRIALCSLCLMFGGCTQRSTLFEKVTKYIVLSQRSDGGWIDVNETALCIKLLSFYSDRYAEQKRKASIWLLSQREGSGGWGKTIRDRARIPITGLLLHLLPQFADKDAINWLEKAWQNDLLGETRLTYKGGFFLMGISASGVAIGECPLIMETYAFLAEEQNDDGGFGPWKNHPIGSDPWSTGIVLLGLVSYPDLADRSVIERAVNWLAENQLPNGLWPYHYIEEGSAYAYWGLVEALKYLSKDSE